MIKPWEMAVSQGFSDVWVYVDFEQKNADDIKGKETLNFVELMQIGKNMKDEQLKSVLDKIDINECEEIIEDYIYYSRRNVRQRCYRGDGSFCYMEDEYEFLIIAEGGEKQAIILRCGYIDLHWYV